MAHHRPFHYTKYRAASFDQSVVIGEKGELYALTRKEAERQVSEMPPDVVGGKKFRRTLI